MLNIYVPRKGFRTRGTRMTKLQGDTDKSAETATGSYGSFSTTETASGQGKAWVCVASPNSTTSQLGLNDNLFFRTLHPHS